MKARNASAGKRRRLVTIQRRVGSEDALGQPLPEAWEDVCEPWANILKGSGSEAVKAAAIHSTVRASIRITFRPGITAGMRVLHGTEIYDIKAVLPDETDRQKMDLACEQVT